MLDATLRPYIAELVCKRLYPRNHSLCNSLSQFPTAENEVQAMAATYIMGYRILVNLPAILLGLFCGAWSDRFGRKLPMMIPSLGSVLAVLLYMVSYMSTAYGLELVLAGAGIQGIMGKSSIITMAVNSYISDISEKDERTRKLGKLQAMNFFGLFAGSFLSGALLETSDFNTVMCVIVVLHGAAILCTVFCVDESVPPNKQQESLKQYLSIFNPANVKNSILVLCKQRKYNFRQIIIALFVLSITNQTCKTGEMDVTVLYVERRPLAWPKSWYGYLLSVDYAIMGLCLFFFLPVLTELVKMPDVGIIMLAVSCKIARSLWAAFCFKSWMVYVSVMIGAFGGLSVSSIRSLLSKSVEEDELGKMFALLASGETASKLLGTIIFTNIYGATTHFFPGCAFLVECGLYVLMFFLAVWLYKEVQLNNTYNLIQLVLPGPQTDPSHADNEEVDAVNADEKTSLKPSIFPARALVMTNSPN